MKLECLVHPLGFQLSPLEELGITQMLGTSSVFCPSMTRVRSVFAFSAKSWITFSVAVGFCRGFPLNPIPVSGVDGQDLKVQVWVRRVSSLRTKCISVVCRWHGSFSFISTWPSAGRAGTFKSEVLVHHQKSLDIPIPKFRYRQQSNKTQGKQSGSSSWSCYQSEKRCNVREPVRPKECWLSLYFFL